MLPRRQKSNNLTPLYCYKNLEIIQNFETIFTLISVFNKHLGEGFYKVLIKNHYPGFCKNLSMLTEISKKIRKFWTLLQNSAQNWILGSNLRKLLGRKNEVVS